MHHVVGKGVTTGMTKFFFKVDDNYESYFDKETNKPYVYIRRINEGGILKSTRILQSSHEHRTRKRLQEQN